MEQLTPKSFFDLTAFEHKALFSDCQYVWQALANIKSYLASYPLGSIESEIPASAHLVDPELITIGANVTIEPGAYIKGPCIIGPGTVVRHGAYLRGNVIIGNNCVVGHDTEMKHSIILNGAKAAHFAYLGDSILGNDTNLGAGTKCANLRLDNGNVAITCEGELFNTGLRKLGAIFGDGTQTGCNTVANPGTITGKEVFCYPGTLCSGYIAANQLVRPHNTALVIKTRES